LWPALQAAILAENYHQLLQVIPSQLHHICDLSEAKERKHIPENKMYPLTRVCAWGM